MNFCPEVFKRDYFYRVILVTLLMLIFFSTFCSSFSLCSFTVIFLSSLLLMFALGMNITKKMDRILESKKINEDRLHIISDHLREFFWMKDKNGVFLMTNKSYALFNGKKTSNEMIGCTLKDLYSEEYAIKERLDDEIVMKERKERVIEENFDEYGEKKCFEVFKTPILNDSGEVTGLIGSARDITERKKNEESLQELKSIINLSPVIAVLWRSEDEFSVDFISENISSLGYSVEKFKSGQYTFKDIICPLDWPFFYKKAMESIARGKEDFSYEYRVQSLEGKTRWVYDHSWIRKNKEGSVQYIQALLTDISQKREVDEEKERLLNELENKNKEMESLIYVASHDLRSPLVNLQGFSQLLEKACKNVMKNLPQDNLPEVSRWIIKENLEEKIPGFLKFILASTSKMDALINGLLKVSRTGRVQLNPEHIEMNKLIHHVIAAMKYQIEKTNSEIIVRDLPDCIGDPGQINQVFTNILSNALMYRDPGKNLNVKISGVKEGNQSHYQVEDNGIGIDKDCLLKIWEIFQRLDPQGEIPGEGLGLPIAKRIIERHGGRIWVESQPQNGSIFHVLLKATEGTNPHV